MSQFLEIVICTTFNIFVPLLRAVPNKLYQRKSGGGRVVRWLEEMSHCDLSNTESLCAWLDEYKLIVMFFLTVLLSLVLSLQKTFGIVGKTICSEEVVN